MTNKLTDEEILCLNQKKWDEWAEKDTLDKGGFPFINFHNYQARTVDLIDFSGVRSFLDLGCGTGWAVSYACGKAGGKGEFYGLDLSQKMIESAAQKNAGNARLHFLQGDSAALPFANDFFDAIICTLSFHHYPNSSKSLAEIHRTLKPGGGVYLLDLTADGIILKTMNAISRNFSKELVNMYSTRQFRRLFAGANLGYVRGYKPRMLMPIKIHIGKKPL